jgi:CarD family transcriptional regulator
MSLGVIIMISIGQVVLYGNQGVFKITGTETQTFGNMSNDYYVLEGVIETGRKVFVPSDNENLTSKMKPVLTPDEVNALIDRLPDYDNLWIDNESLRKATYKEILSSGNRSKMLSLAMTLYNHKNKCQSSGKKMHQCDERAFKEAEKLINGEFGYVLGIAQSEIGKYISAKVG